MPTTKPLSPVQFLEKAGLRPYLEGDAHLHVKVMGLLKLPPERQARVRAYVAEHRQEIIEILRPYHEGRGWDKFSTTPFHHSCRPSPAFYASRILAFHLPSGRFGRTNRADVSDTPSERTNRTDLADAQLDFHTSTGVSTA